MSPSHFSHPVDARNKQVSGTNSFDTLHQINQSFASSHFSSLVTEGNEKVQGINSFDATHQMNLSFVPYYICHLQAESYEKDSRQIFGQPVVMSHPAAKF